MKKTIVGLFSSAAQAQTVRDELVSEGYPASDIRVVAQDGSEGAVEGSNAASEDTSIGAKISHFFHSLTGADTEDTEHYTSGVAAGGALLSVTVPEERQEMVISLLEAHRAQNIEGESSEPSTGTAPAAARATDGVATAGAAIPVVQEDIQVGKRQVQRGGVRVYSHLVETPVSENVVLREEHVHVNRQNVDRPATEADFAASQSGAVELTETAEEAVVGKRARVVEEIVVGKTAAEHTQTISDTVRHTEVEVEQLGDGEDSGVAGQSKRKFATSSE